MKKINIIIFLALAAILGIAPSVSAIANSADNVSTSRQASTSSGRACAQVITSAASSSGECKSFSTPCDVPEGWTVVSSCSTNVNTNISTSLSASINDIKNRLEKLRKDKEAFVSNKQLEATTLASSLKEKVASKKKEIQARLEKLK